MQCQWLHRLSVFRLAKTDVYPAVALLILPRSDPVNPVIFKFLKRFLRFQQSGRIILNLVNGNTHK
jgi:hypothetical protein